MSINVRSFFRSVMAIALLAFNSNSSLANEVPYFTVEYDNSVYAVSKQTAAIAFDYGSSVYQDYCQNLGDNQQWQLAQADNQVKFSQLTSLAAEHGFVDEQGKPLSDIVLLQESKTQNSYFYARLGRQNLLVKKIVNNDRFNGLYFYPLCIAEAKSVVPPTLLEQAALELAAKQQAQEERDKLANARVATGRFLDSVLGRYHQFSPLMPKQEFLATFNQDGELQPLSLTDRQSRKVLYSECARFNDMLPACYEYFDKLYQGVEFDIYAISVGGHVDEHVKQSLASNDEYKTTETKAKSGDNKAYQYLEKLLTTIKQSFNEKKSLRLAKIFGNNITNASGVVFFNDEKMMRYSITLAFSREINYQWKRLVSERFGKPDFHYNSVGERQVFVYTNNKEYQFVPEQKGSLEEQEFLSWLMSKPKSLFKITSDRNYLQIDFETRATYYDNFESLPATAALYVKDAKIQAEKVKQQNSDDFKL